MTTTTIKPGILVALRSQVEGGVSYERKDLALDEQTEEVISQRVAEGAQAAAARWETIRIVTDPAEYERANDIRAKVTGEVKKVCIQTSFGLLAPAECEQALDDAHTKAREMVRAFNAESRYSKITLHLLKGRIASSDEEAVRAIGAEVSALISEMNRGIDRLDPASIRKAASQALQLGAVLDARQQEKVSAAVEEARKAARLITKRVEKEGAPAAEVLLQVKRDALSLARVAFLDLSGEEGGLPEGEALPEANLQRVAALDAEGQQNDDEASEAPSPSPVPAESEETPVLASPEPSPLPVPSPAVGPSFLDFGDDLPEVSSSMPPADPRALEFGGPDAL